jgi:CubicO group peptidase (beta-lactamase class C family)
MEVNGTRLDIAQKQKDLVESIRNGNGTAVSAAFIKDGELISAFSCGTQDGNSKKAASIHDLYCVGSVGKVYCALAVLKLVEMGKVCLDSPVIEYLPRFITRDERYKRITLRMCLNHSSGLTGTHYKQCFSDVWNCDGIYDSFFDYYSKFEFVLSPGFFSVYSNDSYLLLEMVIAKVSGLSYIQFVQEYIAKPAGALSTCTGGNILQNRAYIKEKDKSAEYVLTIGAGGILTDLTDCAKIGYLFIDPKGILTSESLDEITRSQGVLLLNKDIVISQSCGLGWDNLHYIDGSYDFGENALFKSGNTGSFGSVLIVVKKYNLSMAVSRTNDNDNVFCSIIYELYNLLLEEYGVNVCL